MAVEFEEDSMKMANHSYNASPKSVKIKSKKRVLILLGTALGTLIISVLIIYFTLLSQRDNSPTIQSVHYGVDGIPEAVRQKALESIRK